MRILKNSAMNARLHNARECLIGNDTILVL